MNDIIKNIEAAQMKAEVPQFSVGDTVKVYGKIKEGMQRPGFLNADTVGILTNSEGSSYASALLLNYDTLEYLNSLAVSLFDLSRYTYCIAYVETRNGFL